MALTSSSTLSDVLAQLNNNGAWWESEAKAKDRLEAIEWLRTNRARISADSGTSMSFEELDNDRKQLINFLGLEASSANRRHFVRMRTPTDL